MLRVYLGAAPGVGKTYSMLAEGRRRKRRGADVVVGLVETHGRETTAEQLHDLEVLPRRHVEINGVLTDDLDVDAVIARRPDVCLIDELAHANSPGGHHRHRWEDVDQILDAGIDVVTTVNIGHFESVKDVVEELTGRRENETIPDAVVRRADQVELVDSTPEALRRRLAHGNIYTADEVDAERASYFRLATLGALRELTLLWMADQVEVGLERHRGHDATTAAAPLDTRERVVVAITGAPGTEGLIRRAARLAQRSRGSLVAVHITRPDQGAASGSAYDHQSLVTSLGGEFHEVAGDDVASALVEFARAQEATQLVIGEGDEPWWQRLTRRSVLDRVIRGSGAVDVHVVSRGPRVNEADHSQGRRRATLTALPSRRVAAGMAAGLIGVPALTIVLAHLRSTTGLPTVLLLYLTLVVTTATVGGTLPAVVAAVGSFLCANWFFTPPYHRFSIAQGDHVVALVVFLGVALVVSRYVDTAARRGVEAARARGEARTLAAEAATVRAEAGVLADANALRTALLQAVSHDLRTPLASIKASATSLIQDEVVWSKEQTHEFLTTIDDETDRLTALVANLLDMSRIQAGAVEAAIGPVSLEEVVPAALFSLGIDDDAVVDDVPDTVPPVRADGALLERVLANVIQNAVRFSPPGRPVHIDAAAVGPRLHVRVVDRGPGIAAADRDRVFQPFQRLSDNRAATGVGLGLAVANGFVTAMGGTLTIDDTPGGGTTVSITLPIADTER
jgi:K+-sensing histidine kinase KdpD